MALKTIRLELARSKDFPDGAHDRGYEFRAPLAADGHLDADAWKQLRKQCTVRRFWPGEADDEPFYRLEGHAFRPGEYVTITEQDGSVLTFRVAEVR